MKQIILFSFLMVILFSCEQTQSPEEISKNLKNSFLKYLAKEKDTTRAKFQIMNVYYYPENTYYNCEFRVRMKVVGTNIDTLGVMKATISKDFETVKRKW